MKYLKKFNESIHENNFEEFVKDGLVQLLDTGFYINFKNFEILMVFIYQKRVDLIGVILMMI
jgi:hypothetical protein